MTDFLLELLSEEIPARMQDGARAELGKLFAAQMAAAGLSADDVTIWSTPRRLALIARGLPLETAAVSEEFRGPRTSAPSQALEGFLRKTGLTQDQLEDRDGVWFATVEKPGRATRDVLAEAIPAIVRAFAWPKSMRWGRASSVSESLRWVRPLQGIVAILGEELVPCEVDGIASGFATKGHRFHHSGEITIGGAHDYAGKLRACHVIVDQEERRAIIRERAQALCAERGLTWIADEALVAENAGLTEWPVPLLGDFDPAFLEVPPEVVRLTLATNQKYFVCAGADGKLAPAFICTANIEASDGGAAIVAGNRKVLAARLSDARFFWEQDKKTPLATHAEKLSRITFHEKLGTVADKVERVAKLAEWLASEGIVPGCDPALARQAAELCKADLVTEMVGEFPELQGVMGGYYARAEGLPDAVADAIRDHYKPVGQGDAVPTAPVTVAVSLADKLDTITLFLHHGIKPTGSKDPFALRRAAIGIISQIEAADLKIDLCRVALLHGYYGTTKRFGVDAYEYSRRESGQFEIPTRSNHARYVWSDFNVGATEFFSPVETYRYSLVNAREVARFFVDRLKPYYKDRGGNGDILESIFTLNDLSDVVALMKVSTSIVEFGRTVEGLNAIQAYKRARGFGAASHVRNRRENVWEPDNPRFGLGMPVAANYLSNPAELALVDPLSSLDIIVENEVMRGDYKHALQRIASIAPMMNALFESGLMIDPNNAQATIQRLELMGRYVTACDLIADFSKIEE